MRVHIFLLVASGLFALVAVVHVVRALAGWPLVVGSWDFPIWLSLVAAALLAWLSYEGLRLGRRI